MKFLAPVLLVLGLLLQAVWSHSVLAIDLGTDTIKASLVKPGLPFDVLVNRESRRKTPVAVAIRGEERFFGGDAVSLTTRFPQDTFHSLKLLLGQSNHVDLHKALYTNTHGTPNRTSSSVLLTSDDTQYTIEELLAMKFGYIKELAEETAKEPVIDTYVTVPAWFRQAQRQAVIDSLELADLRCAGLVDDGAAAGINLVSLAASDAFSSNSTHYLLYDLGAGSLRTTLVGVRKTKLPPRAKSLRAATQLSDALEVRVLAHAFDTDVSGFHMDTVLRDLLRERFEAQLGRPIDNPRSLARILVAARRAKQILSANSETVARIEGLIDDTDVAAPITRDEFEARLRATGFVDRLTPPLAAALASANLSLPDLHSVILIGGASRVPLVDAAVRDFAGDDRIARNLNGDEASVLGAALYGSSLQPAFRTKDIRLADRSPFAVEVDTNGARNVLFPALTPLGTTETVTLGDATSLAGDSERFDVVYADGDAILSVRLNVTAVKAAAGTPAPGAPPPQLKAVFNLDTSGLVKLQRVYVQTANSTHAASEGAESLTDKVKDLFNKLGDSSRGEKPPVLSDTEMQELIENAKVGGNVSNTDVKYVIEYSEGITPDERVGSRRKLREAKAAEKRRLARAEALNLLEALIYRVGDLVEIADDADLAALGSEDPAALSKPEVFALFSEKKEREELKKLADSLGEWMWDEGMTATTQQLVAKRRDLERIIAKIEKRAQEAIARPASVAAFRTVSAQAQDFVTNMTALFEEVKPDPAVMLPASALATTDLDALKNLSEKGSAWLDPLVTQQAALRVNQNPVVLTEDIDKKTKELKAELSRLQKKRKPYKYKPETPVVENPDKKHDEL